MEVYVDGVSRRQIDGQASELSRDISLGPPVGGQRKVCWWLRLGRVTLSSQDGQGNRLPLS